MARCKPVPIVRPRVKKSAKKKHQEKRRMRRRERRKRWRGIAVQNKAAENECCVCLEAKDEWIFWPCLHKVCSDCADIILSNNRLCPRCKEPYPGSSSSGEDSSDVSTDSEDDNERPPPRALDGRNMISVNAHPVVVNLVD